MDEQVRQVPESVLRAAGWIRPDGSLRKPDITKLDDAAEWVHAAHQAGHSLEEIKLLGAHFTGRPWDDIKLNVVCHRVQQLFGVDLKDELEVPQP